MQRTYEVCNSMNLILLQLQSKTRTHTQKDYPSSDLCTFLFICTDLQWTTSDTGTFNTQKQGPHYTCKTTVVYKQSRRRISSSFFVFFSASGVQFLVTLHSAMKNLNRPHGLIYRWKELQSDTRTFYHEDG